MRRRFNLRIVVENAAVIGGVALIALLVGNLISFSNTRALLPPGSRLGDVDVSGITVNDAISKTVTALATPIALQARDAVSVSRVLPPSEVDFRLNDTIARLQLQPAIDRQQGLSHFPAFLIRQYGPPTKIALPYQYSEAKLQAVLGSLAQQINRDLHDAMPDLNSQRVISAQNGIVLNTAEAERDIVSALKSVDARAVDLPVDVISQREVNVQTLHPALAERLRSFTSIDGNIAAVFIKDLQTGNEISINGDVAMSAARWVTLALETEGVRASPSPISGSMLAQDNAANNAMVTPGRNICCQRLIASSTGWPNATISAE